MYWHQQDKPLNPYEMDKENIFVIVPFGCLPLGAKFRCFNSNWKRADALALSDFAHPTAWPSKTVRFSEDRLVATLRGNIEPNLRKYVVETILD